MIWNRLEEFDLVIVTEPRNIKGGSVSASHPKHKNLFHFNAGVFGYRKSSGLKKVLNRWEAILDAASVEDVQIGAKRNDQEVLNELVFKEHMFKQLGLQVHVLDNLIYNARGSMFKEMKRDHIYKDAIILHCHSVHHSISVRIKHKIISEFRKVKLTRLPMLSR